METIFELIARDDGNAIRELLAGDPKAVDARDEVGVSPLTHALYGGRQAAFEAIRDTGELTDPWDRLLAGESTGLPAPDAWSSDGFTALHLAAFAHNPAAARLLLEAGADPDTLATATFARVTPLGTCAFANEPEVARVLLEHGADPSIAEREGGTPLAVAEANGYTEVAEILRGAS
ncbi:MAG: ankyrin repeat domain-containing protein [Gaiellaceae bacterium]